MDRLGDGDRLEVGYARTMLAPLVPLALVAAAVLGGLSPGAVVLLLLLLLVVLGVSVLGCCHPASWCRATGSACRGVRTVGAPPGDRST